MKTIKYKEQDGYKIIIGAGKLAEDPAAAKMLANNAVQGVINGGFKDFPELKQQADKSLESSLINQRATKDKQKAKAMLIESAKAAAQKDFVNAKKFEEEGKRLEKSYQDHLGAAGVCNAELKELKFAVEPKLKEIRRNNIAYCEPGLGEMVDEATANMIMSKTTEDMITDGAVLPSGQTVDGLISVWMGKPDTEQVCIDGSKVDDYIGNQYFFKDNDGLWVESEIISALNVTKDTVVVDEYQAEAIEKADLTPEQLEEIRIQSLTPEAKEAEKLAAIDSAAAKAANLKAIFDIKGDEDALTKAQDLYASLVAEIELKYV